METAVATKMPTATELEGMVKDLAQARAIQGDDLAEVERLEIELAKTELARQLDTAEDELRKQCDRVKMLEDGVRDYAEWLYEETHQAMPVAGVQIKTFRVLRRGSKERRLMELVDKPRAIVARDLSGYLAE